MNEQNSSFGQRDESYSSHKHKSSRYKKKKKANNKKENSQEKVASADNAN